MFDRSNGLWTLLILVIVSTLATGCGDGSASSESGQGEQQQASTNASQAGGSSGSGYTVDIDEIFPPGPGKELVLNNCQNCHTWVPVVILQMNEQEWDRWSREHRGRVEALTDEQFATLLSYLKENFNPDTPVPELPPALLKAWTSY